MDIKIINNKELFDAYEKCISKYCWLFYFVPLFFGVFLSVLFKGFNDKIVNTINSFLTCFVPLFGTILTIYISWAFSKVKTRHQEERIQIFKETTVAILIMIPIAIVTVFLSFANEIPIWSFVEISQIKEINVSNIINISKNILVLLFSIFYYAGFIKICLIILMVIKRAYRIIINEIRLLDDDDDENTGNQ